MQEMGLSQVCDEIDRAFGRGDHQRIENLLWPALNQYTTLPQLWFYAGNLFFQTDRSALAVLAFERCVDLDENPLVLANLGAAFRRLNHHDSGISVLKAALDRDADYEPALVNLGSMYVNEGMPEAGIPYLEHAVALGKAKGKIERGAMWNLGLLYLEAGRFKEGFEIYRQGLGAERMMRNYGFEKEGIAEPKVLEPSDSGEGKTLIVFGEQGIGDELMFGTCIEQAREEFKEVIFECHPRLEQLHAWAHPGLRLFPHRKDEHIDWPIKHHIHADYKCPLGDLAARYRPDAQSFKDARAKYGVPYKADAVEAASYREQLELIAKGRKIVGLATRGGVMQTARTYRTLKVPDADYLLQNTDCLFVGLDYDDMSPFVGYVDEKYGDRYRWFTSIVQHWDFHHTAALVDACDLVVTVCQSVAHLAAGMGKPTRVLTPKRCAWRYAVMDDPEEWFWYPDANVKLYRTEDTWESVLAKVIQDIKELP